MQRNNWLDSNPGSLRGKRKKEDNTATGLKRALTVVFLRSVASLTGLHAGLPLPAAASPVLRSVRAQIALCPQARALLLLLRDPPAARELVGVQDVEHGEGRGSVDDRALADKGFGVTHF